MVFGEIWFLTGLLVFLSFARMIAITNRPDLLHQPLTLIPLLLYKFLDIKHLVLKFPNLQLGPKLLLLDALQFLPPFFADLEYSNTILSSISEFILIGVDLVLLSIVLAFCTKLSSGFVIRLVLVSVRLVFLARLSGGCRLETTGGPFWGRVFFVSFGLRIGR